MYQNCRPLEERSRKSYLLPLEPRPDLFQSRRVAATVRLLAGARSRVDLDDAVRRRVAKQPLDVVHNTFFVDEGCIDIPVNVRLQVEWPQNRVQRAWTEKRPTNELSN